MTLTLAKQIGIPEKSVKSLKQIFKKFEFIDKVVVYGSRAKGNYRLGSDIDLAIFSSRMSYLDQMNIEDAIDNLLMPYSVDVIHFEKLSNQELIEHINRVGIHL